MGSAPPLGRPGLRERFVHSDARFVVEADLAAFLDGPAADRAVWDFGAGAPPLARGASTRSIDVDPGGRPTVRADLHDLPLADDTVDAGISVAVLEHVRDCRRVVAEMVRCLAPGAPLFVWVPFLHETHGYPDDFRRFTDDGIRELLEAAGLETEACHSRGLTGLSAILGHLYRFLLPPRSPAFGARLAGFAAIRALAPLDRRAPLPDLPIGTTWIGRKPGLPAS